MRSGFVRASDLYHVASRTPIAHPAHQATDADVRRALADREVRADGGRDVTSSSGTDQFQEGDRVRHKGDGVEGEVADTAYSTPYFRVQWEDGVNTLESFHTVERYVDAATQRDGGEADR